MDTLSLGSARSAQEVRLSLCDERVESFRDGRLTSPVYFDGKTGGVGTINEDTQSKSYVFTLGKMSANPSKAWSTLRPLTGTVPVMCVRPIAAFPVPGSSE